MFNSGSNSLMISPYLVLLFISCFRTSILTYTIMFKPHTHLQSLKEHLKYQKILKLNKWIGCSSLYHSVYRIAWEQKGMLWFYWKQRSWNSRFLSSRAWALPIHFSSFHSWSLWWILIKMYSFQNSSWR